MPEAQTSKRDASAEVFEFSDVQKESFRALSLSMSFLGVFAMLVGGLASVFALGAFYEGFAINGIVIGAFAVIVMIMASWLLSAGRSLSAMMRTRGRDVDCLLEAVTQLRRYFGMALVLVMIGTMATIGAVVFCTLGNGKCFGLLG